MSANEDMAGNDAP